MNYQSENLFTVSWDYSDLKFTIEDYALRAPSLWTFNPAFKISKLKIQIPDPLPTVE